MNYIKKIFSWESVSIVSGMALSALIPLFAHAQTTLPGLSSNTTVSLFITNVICVIAAYMFWILVSLAVVFTIVAAYRYLFSGGEPSKVSDATRSITFAAVSIVVALLAKALPFIVASIVMGGALSTVGGAVCP
ncbi:MAG: hypothetical protein Q8P49_01305 [Candidatus Liptonbacteria bacterium]|nr:hypothetical protein [Candidatus Liptonbacteria bacterium]